MNHTELFTHYRDLLFHIAYRMVSTVMDAEDIVQEAYIKWLKVELSSVENPKAYLTTMITRQCIDFLRSAQTQRETYIGPWLPAPLPTTGQVELRDSVSMAFLLLLENLTPPQRAAFLLRDVFDYDYAEIADVIETSPSNCRQMVSRARKLLADEHTRYDAPPEQHEALVQAFFETILTGDIQILASQLAEDVVVYSDGGGVVRAATRPVYGQQSAAQLIMALGRFVTPTMRFEIQWVNGHPALVAHENDKPFSVMIVQLDEKGRVERLFNVLNPTKLAHLSR